MAQTNVSERVVGVEPRRERRGAARMTGVSTAAVAIQLAQDRKRVEAERVRCRHAEPDEFFDHSLVGCVLGDRRGPIGGDPQRVETRAVDGQG